jgi:hypothetical protein
MATDANHILTTTVTVDNVREAAEYMNEGKIIELTQDQRDELAKRLCDSIQQVIEDFAAEI